MVMDMIPNSRLHNICLFPSCAEIFQEAVPTMLTSEVEASASSGGLPAVQLHDIRAHTSALVDQLWEVIKCCNEAATVDVGALLRELFRAVCVVDEDAVIDPHDRE
jgi:hypothetical protein